MAFGGLLALIVAAAACSVGVQYGMKLIVDTMADNDRSSRAIWNWLALFIVLIAAESALWRLSGWLGCITVVNSGVDVRLDLFRHLSGHSLDYFSRHLAGSLGNRVTATAGATGAIFGTLIWKILPPCVDFVGAVVVLCTIDVRMALTLIGFVGLVAAFMFAFGRRARPLQQAFAERASQVGGELVDVVANIFTVMAFSAREREHRRLREAFGLEARAQRRSWLYLEKARAFHDLCLWLMAGAMLIWAVEAWRAGLNEAGDVVLISALTFRILHGSRELALSLVDASQHFGVIAEMLKVVAVPHEVADRPDAAPFVPGPGAIAFHDVHFAYDDGRPVFEHLDLFIPAGQRLGVVGPSGAGKSTFVRLVGRVMDPTRGTVTVDGVDVSSVRQDSLRDAIGVVPQDITLLHRSILENLRYGNPGASDAQVHAAAREALCHDFIMALPQGYDTVVGERGARLSGGQRQRISIARAMLKNAPVLLLDEATSALDSRSEAEIQAALARLMLGRTVVAVAHRLSTVAAFDRIIVLVDGRIVEDGPPGVLIARDGVYASLWRMQAQGQETP
ncbi:ABC transporter related protein [Variovorax paradoxus EPS]|uniref:ABC transporter related protein n=1 Tax=Variovorax paradoxus (strain EPS) TaxID=595537 RepID=E6V7W7_VARPE|nr:ABC transporter related protein [Variovorax paradoxus EPS]